MKPAKKFFLLTAALLALPALATAASVQIDLDFSTATIYPGESVTFSGTVSNLESTTIFLNGCNVNLAGVSVSGGCIEFLLNAPLTLDPLQSGIPSFFLFTVSADLPYLGTFGTQSGSFDVLGGEGSSDLNLLGSANFSVEVASPEPSSMLLALSAGIVLMVKSRRKLAVQSGESRRTILGQCQRRPIQK
jgi:hypothetical protein